jgi:mannosyltransferase
MKKRLVHPTALALALIALGFGLRLYRLDTQSFWYDEAYSAGVAGATPGQVISNRFSDVHPPLYYLALHYWQDIDAGDFTVRLLSAMLGTAGIAAMYALGKTLFEENVGLAASALTCLAPYTVFYGQEARMYSLVLLLSALLLLSYNRMLHTRSRRWWLAYAACSVLSMYVQYVSALLLLALHLHLLVTNRRDRHTWVLMVSTDAIVLLLLAPQLTVLISQTHLIAGPQWNAPATPGFARLLSAPYALTLSQFASQWMVPLGFAAVLVLFIITHLQMVREMVRKGDAGGHLSLVVCALWTPLLLAFAISQWQSIYRERALIVAVPALYLLFSWGVVRTRERYFNLACLLLLGIVALGGLSNWYFDPTFSKPAFRSVGEVLEAEACGDTPIIHTSDGALLILMRYAPRCEHFLLKGDPAAQLPLETYQAFGGRVTAREELPGETFWLVVALDNSVEFQREMADWIEERYWLAEEKDVEGVFLRLYDGTKPQ